MTVRVLLALGLSCLAIRHAHAQEPELEPKPELKPEPKQKAKAKPKSNFTFQYSGLRYQSETESVKPEGGSAEDETTTTLSVTGEDSYGWITFGKWTFYVFPFTGGTPIGLSFMPGDSWEFGSFLGLESVGGDDEAREATDLSLSPFVTYYYTRNKLTLENYLSLDIIQKSAKTVDAAGASQDLKASSLGVTLNVTAVFELSRNLFYVPSFRFAMSQGTENEGAGESETSTSGFDITPIAIRTTFD